MALRIEVVKALPRRETVITVEVPASATVQDALNAAGLESPNAVGIFGERVGPDTRVADGDRIEVYRPLAADPKEARRRRARRLARR